MAAFEMWMETVGEIGEMLYVALPSLLMVVKLHSINQSAIKYGALAFARFLPQVDRKTASRIWLRSVTFCTILELVGRSLLAFLAVCHTIVMFQDFLLAKINQMEAAEGQGKIVDILKQEQQRSLEELSVEFGTTVEGIRMILRSIADANIGEESDAALHLLNLDADFPQFPDCRLMDMVKELQQRSSLALVAAVSMFCVPFKTYMMCAETRLACMDVKNQKKLTPVLEARGRLQALKRKLWCKASSVLEPIGTLRGSAEEFQALVGPGLVIGGGEARELARFADERGLLPVCLGDRLAAGAQCCFWRDGANGFAVEKISSADVWLNGKILGERAVTKVKVGDHVCLRRRAAPHIDLSYRISSTVSVQASAPSAPDDNKDLPLESHEVEMEFGQVCLKWLSTSRDRMVLKIWFWFFLLSTISLSIVWTLLLFALCDYLHISVSDYLSIFKGGIGRYIFNDLPDGDSKVSDKVSSPWSALYTLWSVVVVPAIWLMNQYIVQLWWQWRKAAAREATDLEAYHVKVRDVMSGGQNSAGLAEIEAQIRRYSQLTVYEDDALLSENVQGDKDPTAHSPSSSSRASPLVISSGSVDLEDLTCPICLDTVRECVAIVPCGHNLCEVCCLTHMSVLRQPKCPYGCSMAVRVIPNPDVRALVANLKEDFGTGEGEQPAAMYTTPSTATGFLASIPADGVDAQSLCKSSLWSFSGVSQLFQQQVQEAQQAQQHAAAGG